MNARGSPWERLSRRARLSARWADPRLSRGLGSNANARRGNARRGSNDRNSRNTRLSARWSDPRLISRLRRGLSPRT